MNFEQISQFVQPYLKKYWLPLGLGILGLMFFGYGLVSMNSSNSSQTSDVVFDNSVKADTTQAEPSKIYIDIEGAVVSPGVYELPSTSRLKDALIAASGLSDQADRGWVSQNINLASKVTDGMKIYIRSNNEVSNGSGGIGSIGGSSNGLVNINSASLAELDKLSGVGQMTAQKIIDGRPYNQIDDLFNKKIISKKVFDNIKDKISVY